MVFVQQSANRYVPVSNVNLRSQAYTPDNIIRAMFEICLKRGYYNGQYWHGHALTYARWLSNECLCFDRIIGSLTDVGFQVRLHDTASPIQGCFTESQDIIRKAEGKQFVGYTNFCGMYAEIYFIFSHCIGTLI